MDARLVGEHAERRFQRMREIAHLGARPIDDLGVGLEQQVELGRHRLDLHRIAPGKPLLRPAPDCRELVLESPERPQAIAHLHQDGSEEAQAQHRQHRPQRLGEGSDLALQLVEIASHQEGELLLAAEQREVLLDPAQLIAALVDEIEAGDTRLVTRHAGKLAGPQPVFEQRTPKRARDRAARPWLRPANTIPTAAA